jgi:uncharacterized protein involved in exopolysaccharide biosynthesis
MNYDNPLTRKELLFSIFHTLFKRKCFIVGLTLLTYASFIFGTYLVTPLWKATALVMMEPNPRQQIILFDKLASPSQQISQINPVLNVVEMLTTKSMAEEVVKEFGLDERQRQRGLHPRTFREKAKKAIVKVFTAPIDFLMWVRGAPPGQKNYLADAIDDFLDDAEDIDIEEDTSVIDITIWEESPKLARDIANRLADKIVDKMMNLTRGEVDKAYAFVSGQVDKAGRKLAAAEEALREYKEKNGLVSLDSQSSADIARLSELETEMAEAKVSEREIAERIKEVKGQIGDEKEIEVATSVISRNPHIDELKSAIIESEMKLAALLTEKTEAHPDVVNMKSSISEARRKLKQEAEMVLDSKTEKKNPIFEDLQKRLVDLEIDSYAIKSKMQGLRRAIANLNKNLGAYPSKEERLAKLKREVDIQSGLYENLKAKLEELRILRKSVIGETRLSVIDKAFLFDDDNQNWPMWLLNIPIGFILSLSLALGLAFFIEYWDDTFRNMAELRKKTGKTVFGVLPLLDKEKKGGND